MSLILPFVAAASSVQGHFATALIFVIVGLVFAALALGVAKLLRPSNPSPSKMTSYECGELPSGSSWVRFNVRFYMVALFFLVFDVEVIFLYPWAVVFKQLLPHPQMGSLILGEMVIFLAILTVGLAYVWTKGDLNWVKSLVERPNIPQSSPPTTSGNAAEEEVPAT
jgi:NADH-quinone oxidoreductase subunit A